MHPILSHSGRLALYLAFWLMVGMILSAPLANQAALTRPASLMIALPLAVMYGFVCLSAWYVARSMPLGRTGVVRIAATAMTASISSSAAWLLLAGIWALALARTNVIAEPAIGSAAVQSLLFGFGLLLYLLSLAVGYLLVMFEHSRDADRRGFEVTVQAREAELRSLRAQIDPHFLFNSLHSISALTTIDPPSARRMCVLLAQFLRESVALGAESQITLAQELRLVEQYLDVELVRFGDRLRVAIDAGGAGGALVPPLLLQPLVENAVVHGVAQLVEGGTIRMAANRAGSMLTITLENPCDPDRARTRGVGLGLELLKKRLTAQFGSYDAVQAAEQSGHFRVEVRIPVVTAA
jgi:hypothetical protein